jgi:hypothetical protein
MRRNILLAVAVLLLTPFTGKSLSFYVFGDQTFSSANWSQTQTTTAAGATSGFSQVASGGSFDSGPYGRIEVAIPTAGNYHLMTVYTGQSYSPATQGAISSIAFIADFKTSTLGLDLFFGFTQGSASYFLWQPINAGNATWTTTSIPSSPAADFYDIYSYAHPDFTTGTPIQFGFYVGYTTTGPGFAPKSVDIDNFYVLIATVPEPSSASLVLLGSSALVFARRRKMQR